MNNSNSILEINKKNLIYNYKYLSKLSDKSICAATIKADAYGLGAIEVFKLLLKNGCKNYFLATTEEAIDIRKINKSAKLYVLNGLENHKINLFDKYKLIPIITSKEDLKNLNKKNKFLKFGIHIETGLNRLGIDIEDIDNKLFKNNNLEIIISHLASPEELNNKYNSIQNKKFLKNTGLFMNVKNKSLCSSAGIMNNKKYHYEMVRPGISLYGCVDNINLLKKFKIKPVIKLKGKILQIKNIEKGKFIGYNQTYKTKKKIKVAIVGIGYADGITRNLSNRGKLFFKKESYKIIGRISMDSITVDITKSSYKIKAGQYMEVINNRFTAEKLAKICGTISNEILTSISKRVKRIYT